MTPLGDTAQVSPSLVGIPPTHLCTAVKYLLEADFHWNPELLFSVNSNSVLSKMYEYQSLVIVNSSYSSLMV